MQNGKTKKYTVKWDLGYEQKNLSKTEAVKIAFDLLKMYDNVSISKS
jgi:hypothetical protein